MPRVAVILAGCGRLDGSEVHESTLSLLFLARGGAQYQCFAPDEPQAEVLNHVTNEPLTETRNQMVEAGRIARGDVKPLSEANPADFDALVMPGGSGSLKNLGRGPGDIHPDLKRLIVRMADGRKPMAFICIAPVLAARALEGRSVSLTCGNDAQTAALIERLRAKHVPCTVDSCVADAEHRIVSTPAYMLGPGIADVAAGIEACIARLLGWCR